MPACGEEKKNTSREELSKHHRLRPTVGSFIGISCGSRGCFLLHLTLAILYKCLILMMYESIPTCKPGQRAPTYSIHCGSHEDQWIYSMSFFIPLLGNLHLDIPEWTFKPAPRQQFKYPEEQPTAPTSTRRPIRTSPRHCSARRPGAV